MAVPLTGLPSASVPSLVIVMVLPSSDMTCRPRTWNFPPVFLSSNVQVLASICLAVTVSQGAPVIGYSLPSYLTVELKPIAVPSFSCPAMVTFTPSSTASYTMERLVTGFVLGGVRLDFAEFNFQVPIELSASFAMTFGIVFSFCRQFQTIMSRSVVVEFGKSKRLSFESIQNAITHAVKYPVRGSTHQTKDALADVRLSSAW